MRIAAGIILVVVIPAGLVWYLVWYGLSHIYDAEIEDDGLVFRLFGIGVVRRLKFDEIVRAYDRRHFISTHSLSASMFCVFPLVNRIPTGINPIVIEKKRGFIRYFSVTPRHPDAFLRALKERLSAPGDGCC